jgi:hypothetical protein
MDREHAFAWAETILVIAAIALFFQFFPGIWSGIVRTIDVRYWGWKSYAVVNVIVVLALIGIKAWHNSRAES